MKFNKLIAALPLALILAGCQSQFSPEQVKQIQQISAQTIVDNPGLLVMSANNLQQMQMANRVNGIISTIQADSKSILSPSSPSIGKQTNATATVAVFCDYQANFCQKLNPELNAVVKDNANVKVIFKQLPALGKDSIYAAKMSLAANAQGKFAAFNDSLYQAKAKLTEASVNTIAQNVGVNLTKAKAYMDSNAAQKQIDQNVLAAQQLGIAGVPIMVVMNTSQAQVGKIIVIPSYANASVIKAAVNKVTSNS